MTSAPDTAARRRPAAKPASAAERRREIERWLAREPKPGVRFLPTVNVPALGWLRRALPEDAAARTMGAAYNAALRLTPLQPVLDKADAGSLTALRALSLPEQDALARHFSRRGMWLAGGTGAAFGMAGMAGLVADAPALLVLSFGTVIRIGQCYGEALTPKMAAALFALASADTAEEKSAAWQAALALSSPRLSAQMDVDEAALRDGLERAAEREFAKAALASSLQQASIRLVRRMGQRRVAAILPVVGALAGGAVNARFVAQLSEAAQMLFAARALRYGKPPKLKLPLAALGGGPG